MQERHMSPRILHFTSHQIFWECNETACSETYPNGDPVSVLQDYTRSKKFLRDLVCWKQERSELSSESSNTPLGQIFTLWYDLVSIYSRGALAKNRDKLIAISGITKELYSHVRILSLTYLAGLWRQDLPYSLLWGTPKLRVPETRRVRFSSGEADIAPTWSWALVECGVHVDRRLCGTPHDILAVVEKVQVVPKTTVFGEVHPGGFLKIRVTSYSVRISYVRVPHDEVWPVLHVGIESYSVKSKSSFEILPDEHFIDGETCARSDLRILLILQSKQKSTVIPQLPGKEEWLATLLLELTGQLREYKRFGLAVLRANGSDRALDGAINRRMCHPREELVTVI